MSQPFCIQLPWHSFNVDLPSVDAYVKTIAASTYCGNSADTALNLWFTADPTIVPITPVAATTSATAASVTLDGVTITAETAGSASNVSLTADGTSSFAALISAFNTQNPNNELSATGDTTQIPAAGTIALTGGTNPTSTTIQEASGPSIATQIQTWWAALTSTSTQAVAYTTNKQTATVQAQVAAAMDFGNQMVVAFSAQNILLGITAAGMTKTVRVAMQEVTDCLSTGSLIEAIAEIKAIPSASYDPTFITAARLLAACNQLETYCGLPLSTSLT